MWTGRKERGAKLTVVGRGQGNEGQVRGARVVREIASWDKAAGAHLLRRWKEITVVQDGRSAFDHGDDPIDASS